MSAALRGLHRSQGGTVSRIIKGIMIDKFVSMFTPASCEL